MNRPLIILGAAGFAHDVMDIVDAARYAPHWEVAGFLDDCVSKGQVRYGRPVLGRIDQATQFPAHGFICVIGNEANFRCRPEVVAASRLKREHFATLIHPGASISRRATLGLGVYASYGAAIGGNAAIGDHVSLSPACIISHDSVIGDYTVLAVGAVVESGAVIEPNAFVGSRAVVHPGVRIGRGALIGVGAIVTRDVPPGAVVEEGQYRESSERPRPAAVGVGKRAAVTHD